MKKTLRELAEAVPEEYRGPWMWTGYIKGPVFLATRDRGRLYLMNFARQGMDGAQPVFPHLREGDRHRVLTKGQDLAIREVSYRGDIVGFDNFVPDWLAGASPDRVLALLDALDEASTWIDTAASNEVPEALELVARLDALAKS